MAEANVYEVTHEEHMAARIIEDWDLYNLLMERASPVAPQYNSPNKLVLG